MEFIKKNIKWISIIFILLVIIICILIYLFNINSKYISKDKVKEIVYKESKYKLKKKNRIKFKKIELDKNPDKPKYTVLLSYNYIEFEYVIDAVNGKVIKNNLDSFIGSVELVNSKHISKKEAKKLVLDDIKLKEKDVEFTSTKVDEGYERLLYTFYFRYKNYKYEYTVDAIAKTIVSKDSKVIQG